MGFFDSRKEKPSLNSLSEVEIQEKLYGKLRPPHLTPPPKTNKNQSFKPKAPVNTTSQLAFGNNRETTAKPVSGNAFNDLKSYSSPVSTPSAKPVTGNLFSFAQPDSSKNENSAGDVKPVREIPVSAAESRSPIGSKPIVSSAFPADSHLKKFQTFSQEESKVVANPSRYTPPGSSAQVSDKKFEMRWDWARKVFQLLAEFSIAGILSLGKLGRKLSNRKVMTWIAAVGFLTFVFWGIHSLNSKREKFMTSPVKKVEKKAAELVVADAQPKAEAVAAATAAALPATTTSAVTPPASKGSYVIQVATYASLEDANKLVGQFTQKNFRSFIKSFQRNAAGRVYHSVYIGRFMEYSQAETQLEKFRRSKISEPFQDAFIRSLS